VTQVETDFQNSSSGSVGGSRRTTSLLRETTDDVEAVGEPLDMSIMSRKDVSSASK